MSVGETGIKRLVSVVEIIFHSFYVVKKQQNGGKMNYYMIVDLGTGNSRVAILRSDGTIYAHQSFENVYYKDVGYPDAKYFVPREWQERLFSAIQQLCRKNPEIKIAAITVTGARQTIVLYDKYEQAFLGLPNIDNRGRQAIQSIQSKEYIYHQTGKWVTEDFPAAKLIGLRIGNLKMYHQISKFTSISDWVGQILTGVLKIEHSQAAETQLYDIERHTWSEHLCQIFGIPSEFLPELIQSGDKLGEIKPNIGRQLELPIVPVIVGGADTQVALKSMALQTGDIAIVSGTTSPIIGLTKKRVVDTGQRCWIDCTLETKNYLAEVNPGVTGLNYQRAMQLFFPDISYEEVENEICKIKNCKVTTSLTTLDFASNESITSGGFLLVPPLRADISRYDLMLAILGDIACSIVRQYQYLISLMTIHKSYIMAAGGGFRSSLLGQMIADLTGKEVILEPGYAQASLIGGEMICKEYFEGRKKLERSASKVYKPQVNKYIKEYQAQWQTNNSLLRKK